MDEVLYYIVSEQTFVYRLVEADRFVYKTIVSPGSNCDNKINIKEVIYKYL